MDTEPQGKPQLVVLNSSGNPWTGTEVVINGQVYQTNNRGVLDLQGLVGRRIYSLSINGLRADVKNIPEIKPAMNPLIFRNCTLRISSILELATTTE